MSIASRFTTIVGKSPWSELKDEDMGIKIKPPKSEIESRIVFNAFDCGNATINFNLRVKE